MVLSLLYSMAAGTIESGVSAMLSAGASAVQTALSLAGGYVLWLGVLNIARRAGLTDALARTLRGVLLPLFPELKNRDVALREVSTNLACNMMGLGNAATPAGLKAMTELQGFNRDKERATNAMCMFLVINASSVQLVPTTIITLRTAAGAANPADILLPALIATTISTIIGITAAKLLEKRP